MGSTHRLETLRRPLPTVSSKDALCASRRLTFGVPLRGRQDTDVSRQCFTRRLTVGIAKGVPRVTYGHKKTDGRVGGYIGGLPRWSLTSQYTTKVVTCQVFLG